MNNEFQEYAIEMFVAAICMCKEKSISKNVFLSHGSKQTLKAGLITHYPSMYKHRDSYENLWQDAKIEFYKPLLMSENAYHIFKNNKGSYKKYKEIHKGENEKLLYWEHITPNEIVWKRILNVFDEYMSDIITDKNVLRQKISDCFYGHRLLMITKAEELLLDSTGGRTGQKTAATDDRQNILKANIAEHRIKCLLTKCNVNHLYLDGIKLKKSEIIDENYNFIGVVKEYFEKGSFVIN